MTTIKCKQCAHYYVRMTGANGGGYNPAPTCYLFEDTGRRPNILTQECFEKRSRVRRKPKERIMSNG